MKDTDNIDISNFIDSNLLIKYHNNKLKKLELEKEKDEIFRKAKELSKENVIEIDRLEKENKKIEKIISDAMILLDKNYILLDGNSLKLETTQSVRARSYKKDELISYIKNNELPIEIKIDYKYNHKQLIDYLNSKEYLESIHVVTKEIESYITMSEKTKLTINKIE